MSFIGRLRRGIQKDRETLKGLGARQKVRFCLDYYKGYAFLILAAALVLFYVWDLVHQSRQVIVLQGFFVNDEYNLFPARSLTEEFSDYMGVSGRHRVAFEDSLYVDMNSSSEFTAANQGKIVAYTATKELDFLVVPENLLRFYADSFPLRDITEFLPPDMRDDLESDLYRAADGTGTQMACGLDLRNSRFLKDAPEDARYFLIVLAYTKREEAIRSFLRFAYPASG